MLGISNPSIPRPLENAPMMLAAGLPTNFGIGSLGLRTNHAIDIRK